MHNQTSHGCCASYHARCFILMGRMFYRHGMTGQLCLLFAALLIGVSVMTAVGAFSERVERALVDESGALLAADLLVSSKRDIAPAWQQQAIRGGLQVARVSELRSVALINGKPIFVEAKAVSQGYPLRGVLKTSFTIQGPAVQTQALPSRGEAWPDVQLAARMNLRVGDDLQLGKLSLRVGRLLRDEPDRAASLLQVAPRLMLNRDDLAATGLLGVGVLKRESLLLAGATTQLAAFRHWLEPQLGALETLQSAREARPEMKAALIKAERFLGLAALVATLLAAVAIAMAAHRHAHQHRGTVALMRCLGGGHRQVLLLFVGELLLLGVLAGVIGGGLGLLGEQVLVALLQDLFSQHLPAHSWWPMALALLMSMLLLMGFALPPLLRLRSVPPLRVWRGELQPAAVNWWGRAVALSMVAGLCVWQSGDVRLAMMVLAGALLLVLLLSVSGWLMIWGLQALPWHGSASWRYAIRSLVRHTSLSVIQVVAFGLALCVLLLLTLVRSGLLEGWQQQLPEDTPNTFLINVQAGERIEVVEYLQQYTVQAKFYPMIKGRLVAVNGQAVRVKDFSNERARRLLQREFNLSWATVLRRDNHLTAGHWWQQADDKGWSVESGLAKTLGLKLGDELRFDIAGESVNATIRSLREVDWDSFKANFFVLAPPGQLPESQASYMSAFYIPPAQAMLGGKLLQRFPTLTMLDVGEILKRVRQLIERVTLAVEFIFVFTLLAGAVVLLAAVQASRDERLREVLILRTLGASQYDIRRIVLAEFVAIGLLSATLAAAAASLLSWLLASQLFHIPWQLDAKVWLLAWLAGGVLVPLLGLLAMRNVWRIPPWRLLRGDIDLL